MAASGGDPTRSGGGDVQFSGPRTLRWRAKIGIASALVLLGIGLPDAWAHPPSTAEGRFWMVAVLGGALLAIPSLLWFHALVSRDVSATADGIVVWSCSDRMELSWNRLLGVRWRRILGVIEFQSANASQPIRVSAELERASELLAEVRERTGLEIETTWL
jgi:hypothetical protein